MIAAAPAVHTPDLVRLAPRLLDGRSPGSFPRKVVELFQIQQNEKSVGAENPPQKFLPRIEPFRIRWLR
jgi:hypothetical protein